MLGLREFLQFVAPPGSDTQAVLDRVPPTELQLLRYDFQRESTSLQSITP